VRGGAQDVALADERSIDDQLQWLHNEHVLYSVPGPSSPAVTNVWTSKADGKGTATRFLDGAYSPAVVR
jgi:translation initiation factor RLI1